MTNLLICNSKCSKNILKTGCALSHINIKDGKCTQYEPIE